MHEKSRADLCRAMFDVGQISRFMAVSRRLGKGGAEIYNSTFWAKLEHENAVNTSWLADQYLIKHPEIEESLEEHEDEYSVLPYKNKNFDNYIRLLEEELAREYAGGQAFIDPGYMAYAEGSDGPVVVNDSFDNDQPEMTVEKQFKPNQKLPMPVTQSMQRKPPGNSKSPKHPSSVNTQPMAHQPVPSSIPVPVPKPQIPNIPYGPYVKPRKKRQVERINQYQGQSRRFASPRSTLQ